MIRPDLLKDIQASLHPAPTDNRLKGLHETHREGVSESTRTIEDQTSPGDPQTRAVGFETRYTEVMVFKQFKRTYSETHHELEKMGRQHAELIKVWTKEKCERIWTEQLLGGVQEFRELNLLDTETEPQMPLTRLISGQKDITEGLHSPDTTRPTALETLDMERVDRFAEILGFFPEQRLMYFKKFFGDADQGSEAFQYVEENAILYTMCFNPSYCWIICSVLKSHFMTPEEERGAAPRTVTELFVMFLHNILTKHKREAEDLWDFLVKLGKMAHHGVVNRTLVFYENQDMSTFGLQPVLSSPFLSGFLKEILQRESTLEHTTYTFYHLTLQEFMAACSFYLDPSGDIEELLVKLELCKDGRFEILTRFLAGLARDSVFKTLGGVMGSLRGRQQSRY
ncbi:NACHT, LRR and PYD domains-containing protein 3-like [Polypterus senegalus]|uniref:NACHT, LRR and PYD domains-containing protein 3-like n=1 Tax=Polypterus senegalus TaxID=55291 RepID=UPI001962D487|nr:NACHT, LRR and PYD domains-containing protein 3-like [Polypterus senegalus]